MWILIGTFLWMGSSGAQGMTFCTEDWNPVCCQLPSQKTKGKKVVSKPVVAPNACKCGARKGKVVPGAVEEGAQAWKACNGNSKGL